MSQTTYNNPFSPENSDRHAIWEMLVKRDIQAFVQQNWSMVADDFLEQGFMGIGAHKLDNPDSWTLAYPTLAAYRDDWLNQAKVFAQTNWDCDAEQALHDMTNMRDIEIAGNSALLHKKFDGEIAKKDGSKTQFKFQTLYRCLKVEGQWKIAGFTGYMPFPMGEKSPEELPGKYCPSEATQHVTAGPYSPVLQVNPGQLVVISGQAAIDPAGNVIGKSIEEQTRLTLENCSQQLQYAGCELADVFKVNVYLENLDDWPRFNEVYLSYMPKPLPVRTAVQAGLLMDLIVEVEMWGIKR
ncbi:MAG: RidA family protein [Thalassotalea sp.]|nr:RidA family protein [Thalassotalea sp.]